MSTFDSIQRPRNHVSGQSRFSDKLQGIPDSRVSAAFGEPQPFCGPVDATLSDREQEFADGMALLYKTSVSQGLTRSQWMADDTFTCDGGALAAKLLADRLGIPATLEVGVYWHTDAEMRAEVMGWVRGDSDTDEVRPVHGRTSPLDCPLPRDR